MHCALTSRGFVTKVLSYMKQDLHKRSHVYKLLGSRDCFQSTRAKPHLRKVKPNHVSKTVLALSWLPSIKSLLIPRVHVRPRLK